MRFIITALVLKDDARKYFNTLNQFLSFMKSSNTIDVFENVLRDIALLYV